MKIAKMILLSLPLVLAIAALIYLSIPSPIGSEQLAPAPTKPLFYGVLLFAIGYLVFLWMLFADSFKKPAKS